MFDLNGKQVEKMTAKDMADVIYTMLTQGPAAKEMLACGLPEKNLHAYARERANNIASAFMGVTIG